MPTQFTNTAGFAGLMGGALWAIALATFLVAEQSDFDSTWVYLVWTASVLAAGGLTTWATSGLRQRLGGLGGLGLVGFVVLAVGVVFSLIAWAAPVWMTIQGVGMLFIALAAWPMRVAPRLPMIAYGSGMLLGAIAFAVSRALEVGSIDQWGDYPAASRIGITVGFAITAAGVGAIGWWLRSEEPSDLDTDIPDQPITA